MKRARKVARDFLTNADIFEYDKFIKFGKLSARQKQISDYRFVEGKSNFQIAMEMNISVETVRNEIRVILDRTSKMISKGII